MKKSLELFMPRFNATPIPMTNVKYRMRISQSTAPSWMLCVSGMGTLRMGHAEWHGIRHAGQRAQTDGRIVVPGRDSVKKTTAGSGHVAPLPWGRNAGEEATFVPYRESVHLNPEA
jgi:hypothetical protein